MAGVSRANEGPDSITIKPLYGTFHAINRYVQDDVSLHYLIATHLTCRSCTRKSGIVLSLISPCSILSIVTLQASAGI